MNNTLKITAIDAVNKKINFINMVASSLCLDNLKAIHYRAEEYVKNNRNTFDKVTSRAVAHLSTISEYSLPFVKIGGEMIAYKSLNVDNELQESKNAIKILGGTVKDIKRYNLSEMERFIVVIEKIKETPAKYPRSQNKPRINPLK